MKKKRRKAKAASPAPPTKRPALKERHRRFVETYMANGGNGAEAARAAGYSGTPKVLATRAAELMQRDDVRLAINQRVQADPTVMTREERQQFWSDIARDETKATKDRLEASKILGRAQGDFIDRKEVHVTGGVVIFLPDNGRGDGPKPQMKEIPATDAKPG